MKTRDTHKTERRMTFRGWRRHIGASERVQFEEGRKKVEFSGLQEEALSSPSEFRCQICRVEVGADAAVERVAEAFVDEAA